MGEPTPDQDEPKVDPRIAHLDYSCTRCGTPTEREDLVVKRVRFSKMGRGGALLRSRTAGWLCSKCLEDDPDWNAEKLASAPGMKGTKIRGNE